MRRTLAPNRKTFYGRGICCRWRCASCWRAEYGLKGEPIPGEVGLAAFVKKD